MANMMKDEFSNRLTMFETTLGTINDPQWLAVWQGKPPLIFAARVGDATEALADLEEFCRRQGVVIKGSAVDKDREETELENLAFQEAKVLAEYYRAAGNETEAAKYDFPITHWRELRDSQLLADAKSLQLAIKSLAAGSDAAEAAKYDLTAATASALEKEWEDYNNLVTAPAQAIGGRKALKAQLRQRFNVAEAKFVSLDNLVGKFGGTPLGRDFVATYLAARIVRDAGHGGTPPPVAGGTAPV